VTAPRPSKRTLFAAVAALVLLVVAAVWFWRDDIISTTLDPKQPFQTYAPPPAPDYRLRSAWAQLPAMADRWTSDDGPADIFFIHPTTFDGGRHWNAPIDDRSANRLLARTMIPNYAGPFQKLGRVFAPHYRQASLYSLLINRDDSRDARRFAYADVKAAFEHFATRLNRGRPIIIVGVEQGGQLAARLVAEAARDPAVSGRIAAVYLIDAIAPSDDFGPASPLPACTQRSQARCVVGWISAADDETAQRLLRRAFVWNARGGLVPLGERRPLCVNPLTGARDTVAGIGANLGAANASGMEWGARPGFLSGQVSAACRDGVLRVSAPTSPSLRISGAWADRRKVAPYNLFYADIEADAKARLLTYLDRTELPKSAPSIDVREVVREVPTRRARPG
jgi:hypothetical protein